MKSPLIARSVYDEAKADWLAERAELKAEIRRLTDQMLQMRRDGFTIQQTAPPMDTPELPTEILLEIAAAPGGTRELTTFALQQIMAGRTTDEILKRIQEGD